MKWFIWDGKERMEMGSEGQISRFDSRTGERTVNPSPQWRILGAREYNNFGNVVAWLTLADVKAACNALNWQYKNGKQRIFLVDFDHGSRREWRSPNHSVYSA